MKSVAFKPLADRILVRRVDVPDKTPGGVYITSNAEKPSEGEVMAVGDGKVLNDGSVYKLKVEVGNRILFGKYSGSEVKIEDEDYIVMREDDVLGILVKRA